MRRLVLPAATFLLAVVAARLIAQAPASQVPFRSNVDVIQLDVSVLDRSRRPVRGLTTSDFTVFEDGKPQEIVGLSEVDAIERDAPPSVRMLFVPPDVSSNDLADQAGGGRLLAIVIDDKNIPPESMDIVMSTRAVARYILDGLGPSDLAAVVFAREAGRTQDFTNDHRKLAAAVDQFNPRPLSYLADPGGAGPMQGDIQRFATTLARSRCLRSEPVVPTLDTVVSRFATIPNRRKTLIFLSVGVPMIFGGGDACDGVLSTIMKNVFAKAQRANVNIHSIDPSGEFGFDQYAMRLASRGGRRVNTYGYRFVGRDTQARLYFSRVASDQTGGRAIVSTDAIEPAIDQILEEDAAYYLLGYQSSNGRPDGKFRRLQVRVNRRDVTVRTRSGYWGPTATATNPRGDRMPSSTDLSYAGMTSSSELPLRVNLVPLAPTGQGRDVIVAGVLSVRLPPLRTPTPETLTVTRSVYDADGRSGPPVVETSHVTLEAGASDLTHDMFTRLVLVPGRYQVRFNVHSTALDRNSTVYADVEVPDFTRGTLVLSGIGVGTIATPEERKPVSATPVTMTSQREFSQAQHVTAFLRVFENHPEDIGPIALTVQVLDSKDATVASQAVTLDSQAFASGGGAEFQFPIPLAQLARGPHLLTITAQSPNGRSVRRDLVFRVN